MLIQLTSLFCVFVLWCENLCQLCYIHKKCSCCCCCWSCSTNKSNESSLKCGYLNHSSFKNIFYPFGLKPYHIHCQEPNNWDFYTDGFCIRKMLLHYAVICPHKCSKVKIIKIINPGVQLYVSIDVIIFTEFFTQEINVVGLFHEITLIPTNHCNHCKV